MEAFFSGMEFSRDDSSRGGHIVFRIPGFERNIAIPRNRKRLARETFRDILLDMGTDLEYFRRNAGTPRKLRSFCKQRRK
ncbi:MAG: hypothetical protein R3F46_05470 [bacterium]